MTITQSPASITITCDGDDCTATISGSPAHPDLKIAATTAVRALPEFGWASGDGKHYCGSCDPWTVRIAAPAPPTLRFEGDAAVDDTEPAAVGEAPPSWREVDE